MFQVFSKTLCTKEFPYIVQHMSCVKFFCNFSNLLVMYKHIYDLPIPPFPALRTRSREKYLLQDFRMHLWLLKIRWCFHKQQGIKLSLVDIIKTQHEQQNKTLQARQLQKDTEKHRENTESSIPSLVIIQPSTFTRYRKLLPTASLLTHPDHIQQLDLCKTQGREEKINKHPVQQPILSPWTSNLC